MENLIEKVKKLLHSHSPDPLTSPQLKHLLTIEKGGIVVEDSEKTKYLAVEVVGFEAIKVVTKTGKRILVPVNELYLSEDILDG